MHNAEMNAPRASNKSDEHLQAWQAQSSHLQRAPSVNRFIFQNHKRRVMQLVKCYTRAADSYWQCNACECDKIDYTVAKAATLHAYFHRFLSGNPSTSSRLLHGLFIHHKHCITAFDVSLNSLHVQSIRDVTKKCLAEILNYASRDTIKSDSMTHSVAELSR
jgi:hypothetical protein